MNLTVESSEPGTTVVRANLNDGQLLSESYRLDGGNAPDSRVALPPPFALLTPANHQQVTNGEAVVVSWSPTGAPASVTLSYYVDCTFPSGSHGYSAGKRTADENADGQESVASDPMVTFDRKTWPLPPVRCSIDVTIGHELQGRVDPAFHKGIALGIVSRKVNLDYIPR